LRYPDGAKPRTIAPSERAPLEYEQKLLDEVRRKELRK
jgi:hypothetical protein